ncbi:PucR family transcriptional regulator [Pseudonocardia sp. RS010]|uniref:PucR family transcriptional regulator n=1 Tax=Pseudonocardia sp. RS010 TaxID=3385979 RepID=UPI0039A1D24C
MHSPRDTAASSAPNDDARWAGLVGRLRADSGGLVDEFVDRVRRIPPYGRGLVPPHRLVTDADLTFDHLLRRIAGQDVPERLAGLGEAIGRDRARRGVPLNELLSAVRLDFRVLWSALRDRAAPEELDVLVSRVERVWAVVEDYTLQIQAGYQEEAALLARERHGERTALVGELLGSENPDPELVERVALALDVDVDADFLVAAAGTASGAGLRRAAEGLAAGDRVVHVQPTGPHSVLVAAWEGGTGAPVRAVLDGVPCGVGPIAHGLATVPRCARLATEIAGVTTGPGPVEVADAWLPLAAERLADTAAELVDSVLSGLAAAAPAERDRLLETVRVFAETGSVKEVAERSFCHRNTVLNRLRRFTALTGRDLAVPADAAVVLLALAAANRGLVALGRMP